MSAPYFRTAAQKRHDHLASKEFEAEVGKALGPRWRDQTSSTNALDFLLLPDDGGVPAALDVKEKRQPLTERWWLLEGVPERELFVIDELSIRKALYHYPTAYFLLRDVPGGDRLFFAPVTELAFATKAKRNRVNKGKWIVDLREFHWLADGLDELEELIEAHQVSNHLRSECIGIVDVEQV